MNFAHNLLSRVNEARMEYYDGNYFTWFTLMLECALYCLIVSFAFLVCLVICLAILPIYPIVSAVRWLRSVINDKQ